MTSPTRPYEPVSERHQLAVLGAGLAWLYEVEQPDDAVQQHHGESTAWAPERRITFVPRGWDGTPLVMLDASPERWDHSRKEPVLLNPLTHDEWSDLRRLLDLLGVAIGSEWNGPPGGSGSLALVQTCSRSLEATVTRYLRGCPTHESVFCYAKGCDWFKAGRKRLVLPAWPVPQPVGNDGNHAHG